MTDTNTATAAANGSGKRAAGAPKAADRIEPVFTEVTKDIPLPQTARRGGRSPYEALFDSLTEVGMSFGVQNKSKKQLSSVVSKRNNAEDNQRTKIGADGQPVTKAGEPIKDANGVVVSEGQRVNVTERIKEFVAHDVDPKKDPQKASVRIFRVK